MDTLRRGPGSICNGLFARNKMSPSGLWNSLLGVAFRESLIPRTTMHHLGYHWTIRPSGEDWRWEIRERDEGGLVLEGLAPSRAVAAALVIRTLARGAVEPARTQDLAA